ncbi:MAG: hypothetical protein ACI38A_09915, partial [Candidatus Ornithomonoglobus sp.]
KIAEEQRARKSVAPSVSSTQRFTPQGTQNLVAAKNAANKQTTSSSSSSKTTKAQQVAPIAPTSRFSPDTTQKLAAAKEEQKQQNAAKAQQIAPVVPSSRFSAQTAARLQQNKSSSSFTPSVFATRESVFRSPNNPYSQSPAVRMKMGKDAVPEMQVYTDRRYQDENGRFFQRYTFGNEYDKYIAAGMQSEDNRLDSKEGTLKHSLDQLSITVPGVSNLDIIKADARYKDYAGDTVLYVTDLIDDKQRANYYYLLGRYGKDEAEKYIKLLEPELISKAIQEKRSEAYEKYGSENKIRSMLGFEPLGIGAIASGEGIKNTALDLMGLPRGVNSTQYGAALNHIREGAMQSLTEHKNLSFWYEQIYGLESSGMDMILSYIPVVGKPLAMVSASGRSMSEKQAQQIENGTYGSKRAVVSNIFTGAVNAALFSKRLNAVFSKLPGTALKKITSRIPEGALKSFLVSELTHSLTMAGISVTSSEAENLADTVIMGNESSYSQFVKQYEAQGYSRAKAVGSAVKDVFFSPMLNAAVSGALMGAVMGFGDSLGQAADISARGRQLEQDGITYADIYKTAKAIDPEGKTAAGRNAEILQERYLAKKKITYAQLAAQDMLNNITAVSTSGAMTRIADLLGVRIEVKDLGEGEAGRYENGVIYLNSRETSDRVNTFYHEAMHALAAAQPETFNKYAASLVTKNGYQTIYNDFVSRYEAQGKAYDENLINADIAAEFGINFFADEKGMERLARLAEGNPTVFDAMYEGVSTIRDRLINLGKSKYHDEYTGITVTREELGNMKSMLETALLNARETGYSDTSPMHRLKRVDDLTQYGMRIDYELDLFRREFRNKFDKDFNTSKQAEVLDLARQAFKAFDNGNDEAGRAKLETGGNILLEHYKKDAPDSFVSRFVNQFEEAYKNGKLHRIAAGTDDAGVKDLTELGISTPRYMLELANRGHIENAGFGAEYNTAAENMRQGFTILRGGGNENEARIYLDRTSDYLLNGELKRDPESGSMIKAHEIITDDMRREYTDKMILRFKEEQPAAEYTDTQIRQSDMRVYKCDIETGFRNLGVDGITEGEVKAFSDITRSVIDRITDADDLSAAQNDIVQEVNAVVQAKTAGRGRSSVDMVAITSRIYTTVREAATLRVRDKIHEAHYTETTSTDAAKIEAAKETISAARKQINKINLFADNLLDMRMRNPAAKVGRTAVSEELKSYVQSNSDSFYKVAHHAETYEQAMSVVAHSNLYELADYIETKQDYTAEDVTISNIVIMQLDNVVGDHERAAKLWDARAKKLTQYGQATEAMSMFYKMSATGKVAVIQKEARRALQAQLNLFSKEYRDYAKKRIDDAAELDNRERTAAEKTLTETDTNFRERSAAVKRWEA